MKNFLNNFIGFLLAVLLVGTIMLIPISIFWGLWNWIAYGIFGLPALGFFEAMGFWALLLIVGSFFKTRKKD